MASLEVNGSVSCDEGASSLPGTVHQDEGVGLSCPATALSEASLEGKGEGGGHWDRLLLR